jgi:hypothetical protein
MKALIILPSDSAEMTRPTGENEMFYRFAYGLVANYSFRRCASRSAQASDSPCSPAGLAFSSPSHVLTPNR